MKKKVMSLANLFFSPALVLFPKNSEHLVIDDIWYTRQHIDIYSDITKNGVPEIQ